MDTHDKIHWYVPSRHCTFSYINHIPADLTTHHAIYPSKFLRWVLLSFEQTDHVAYWSAGLPNLVLVVFHHKYYPFLKNGKHMPAHLSFCQLVTRKDEHFTKP